jgi:DNA-binding beta-propeller fold protein YncE
MRNWLSLSLLLMPLALQNPSTPDERAAMDAHNAELRKLLQSTVPLAMDAGPIPVKHPDGAGLVSWVAADRQGLVYLLRRTADADSVLVIDREGRVVRSWGKGLFTTAHAIRVDPRGNVWTVDAASSMVYNFSHEGKTLLQIEVGGQPTPCGNFCSTTDIAFAPDGNLFIADGYRNARILEYSPDGKKLREWGQAGSGPGEFRLPHSIQVSPDGVVYVADRENGRIQRFDRKGSYLGEWRYGKTFGLKLAGDAIWLTSIPRGPNGVPGWLLKVDIRSGNLLGWVDAIGMHGIDLAPSGDVLHASPVANEPPQRHRVVTQVLDEEPW